MIEKGSWRDQSSHINGFHLNVNEILRFDEQVSQIEVQSKLATDGGGHNSFFGQSRVDMSDDHLYPKDNSEYQFQSYWEGRYEKYVLAIEA
jgi:hypothetical protein